MWFLLETEQTATNLQLTLDEYMHIQYQVEHEDIFPFLVNQTEEKLKEILFIGAAAQEGKAGKIDDVYREFSANMTDWSVRSEAGRRYTCLYILTMRQLYSIPVFSPI